MNKIDRKNLSKILQNYVSPNAKILDIGCGIGENISLLKKNGYKNIIGIDISPEMVRIVEENGDVAFTPNCFNESNFDVLLFSHVIEHISYPEIQSFFEFYFSKAKKGALIIIITPAIYDAFYNDIDHIRPYYPDGLIMLFSEQTISRQYGSIYRLSLKDIYFRRELMVPYNIRSKYLKSTINIIWYRVLIYGLAALKFISFGAISKVTGYAAVFKLTYTNGKLGI